MATVEKMPMLKEGYEKLHTELKRLKKAERPPIIDAIEEARAGDLSENAGYHAAKERQGHIEATISDIEGREPRQIIDPRTCRKQGCVRRDRYAGGRGQEGDPYQLVGQHEAVPVAGSRIIRPSAAR